MSFFTICLNQDPNGQFSFKSHSIYRFPLYLFYFPCKLFVEGTRSFVLCIKIFCLMCLFRWCSLTVKWTSFLSLVILLASWYISHWKSCDKLSNYDHGFVHLSLSCFLYWGHIKGHKGQFGFSAGAQKLHSYY